MLLHASGYSTFVKLHIRLFIKSQKKILVAPLDWGLGHTTRCVPIIQHLLQLGHKVTVAGNDWQLKYLTATFPVISTLPLEGYNVWYSKRAIGFIPALFMQLPRLLKTMQKEHQWLKRVVAQYGFDGVISDNRYGLYHSTVPNVIICHQVVPQSGWGSIPDAVLRKLHNERLSRFNTCWVPDIEGKPNLAGALSHPVKTSLQLKYLGLLSQVKAQKGDNEYLLVLLSGPEPQRSILSDLLWEQMYNYEGKIVFVEGSDEVEMKQDLTANISYYKRITRDVLEPILANASLVICRSGYSTLMDLAILKKKAIIIPTPGQAEQEYLAKHLHSEGVFYGAKQAGFNLKNVLNSINAFPFKSLNISEADNQFRQVLEAWASAL